MFKLTKRAVDALEPGETEYFEWDSDLTNFGVRVYPTGRKSYLIQYRARGRSQRYTIGRHGALTADEARKLARRFLGEVAQGGNPAEERQRALRAPTIAALCDRFLTDYVAVHCKPSTAAGYGIVIRRCIRPRLGSRKIAEVTRSDIVEFHHGLRDRPYMANRAVSILSKLFNLAEDWGLRTDGRNPARRIKRYREEEKKRFLSNAEQVRLCQALDTALETDRETVHAVTAIYLLLLTGCRLGEVLTLKWDYVTATHLELPDSKTGRKRVPLPREAYDLLSALPRREGNPYVILGEDETGHLVNLQKPWRRIRQAAGLEDVRMHDLRHTYASVAMMSGTDPFLLKEIMGHRNLQTTMRYAHYNDHAVQSAAGAVASRLARGMGTLKRGGPGLRVVS